MNFPHPFNNAINRALELLYESDGPPSISEAIALLETTQLPLTHFQWDEICNEITVADPTRTEHGDWRAEEWQFHDLLDNGVVVLKTDRHWALECWATDVSVASILFSGFPQYEAMQSND